MTTTAEIEVRGRGRNEGFARGPVLLIDAAVAVVLAVASDSRGYMFDEAQFLAAGHYHLAWGYFDQPPLVPALAGWMDQLAPGSLLVFRLPVTLIIWAAVRWVRVRDDRLLLLAGVVTGLSMNTKFLVPALWVALLVGVAVCGPREMLCRPGLWTGLGIAAVMTCRPWPGSSPTACLRADERRRAGRVGGLAQVRHHGAGAPGARRRAAGVVRGWCRQCAGAATHTSRSHSCSWWWRSR